MDETSLLKIKYEMDQCKHSLILQKKDKLYKILHLHFAHSHLCIRNLCDTDLQLFPVTIKCISLLTHHCVRGKCVSDSPFRPGKDGEEAENNFAPPPTLFFRNSLRPDG